LPGAAVAADAAAPVGANLTEVNTSEGSMNCGNARQLTWFVPLRGDDDDDDDDDGDAASHPETNRAAPVGAAAVGAAPPRAPLRAPGAAASAKAAATDAPAAAAAAQRLPVAESTLVAARLRFGVCAGLWRMRGSVLDPLPPPSQDSAPR
jgi:hypothetical protein